MAIVLLEGERLLHTSKANAVIVPSEYGLSQFAAADLLGLAGLGGKEAIGGHVHVTSLRLAFAAHSLNRLKGVLSVPLSVIENAGPWRSGLAVGVEVTTASASFKFVSWSRAKVLAALATARAQYGPAEHALILEVRDAVTEMEIRIGAEILNVAARTLFDLTGAKPSAFDVLSRIEFKAADRQPPGAGAATTP